jgi:hypothetical protein
MSCLSGLLSASPQPAHSPMLLILSHFGVVQSSPKPIGDRKVSICGTARLEHRPATTVLAAGFFVGRQASEG